MNIFRTGDEMIEAITNCKDPKEAKDALAIVVKFALHDRSIADGDYTNPGLPNQVMLSMLILAVQGMGKPKGGD